MSKSKKTTPSSIAEQVGVTQAVQTLETLQRWFPDTYYKIDDQETHAEWYRALQSFTIKDLRRALTKIKAHNQHKGPSLPEFVYLCKGSIGDMQRRAASQQPLLPAPAPLKRDRWDQRLNLILMDLCFKRGGFPKEKLPELVQLKNSLAGIYREIDAEGELPDDWHQEILGSLAAVL